MFGTNLIAAAVVIPLVICAGIKQRVSRSLKDEQCEYLLYTRIKWKGEKAKEIG